MKLLELLEYNVWANDLFITRLQEQPGLPEDITKLFSHILAAQQVWISRIAGKKEQQPAWKEIAVEEWEELNIGLYNETTDLLKANDLRHTISYTTSAGELYHNSMEDILHHLINHSMHHRAQVALLMRKNELLPPQGDYIFYLRR